MNCAAWAGVLLPLSTVRPRMLGNLPLLCDVSEILIINVQEPCTGSMCGYQQIVSMPRVRRSRYSYCRTTVHALLYRIHRTEST